VHLLVLGRVQGVGFRAMAADVADRLELIGWVRNRPDGSVEIEAEGPDPQMAEFVAWCRHGPRYARVDTVELGELALGGGETVFEVRR
jgi:acylphosphatase